MALALNDTDKDVSTLSSTVGIVDGHSSNCDVTFVDNLMDYPSLNASGSYAHLLPNDDGSASIGNTESAPAAGDNNSLVIFSPISTINVSANKGVTFKSASTKPCNAKNLHAFSVTGKSCRFPKLEECAHFHYERVQLGSLSACLVDDKSELLTSSIASDSIGGDIPGVQLNANALSGSAILNTLSPTTCWFIIKVFPHFGEPFLIKRSFANMQMLDEMMHRCVYDRKISGLKNLTDEDLKTEEEIEYAVIEYLERFSKIASDSLTCGTILTWFQLDNKGRRLPLADGDTMQSINTPAVGAAYGVRRYQAQAPDEISIEVGDMISVIDMPSPAESIWWRGKKSHLQKSHYEVGFFPQSCVAIIGDKVPRYFPMPAPLVGQLDISPTKPVLRKHGKLIAFFRSFILSRPSRRRLKQSGIYRERVFSCDLSEHLLNSGQDIPMVLKCCAEFIESYGIVDGIYRLSGITSNIQRLRRSFDEECIPDLGNPEMKQDIHAVSSLLKMYFRELPNPLCTYQLYDNFVEAIQTKTESCERLRLMKETVLKLPPPHYRTLKYLSQHLNKISQHSARTGMTDKNLAIVWAPNLLRCPALESGGVAALRGVGVQAVVTEYLIRNCHDIFEESDDAKARLSFICTTGGLRNKAESRMDSLTDCESLLVEQREHDQSLTFMERPKSLSCGGPKLISLEEAQERHSRFDNFDIKQSMPISVIASNTQNTGSYIEVGGGPSSLPDKYHTVLSAPRNWQKRKTHSWKSLFTRSQRSVSNGRTHNIKTGENATISVMSPPCPKDAIQVSFAEANAVMNNAEKTGKALAKQGKLKSVEFFDTARALGSEARNVSVRSNSIDSLRTTGHSRSVSHDSYFDVLQSPHRGHVNTCLTRELSELGINFDREEPEMRLFSDSESLVSSPRVYKDNLQQPLASNSRRILRARPEDFSSQTNSVNPSPKKQPRLNILLSPNSTFGQHLQVHASKGDVIETTCRENANNSNDENYCKRYKLEDELSDIQFIDCSTPEHMIAHPQTMYGSIHAHAGSERASATNFLRNKSTKSAMNQELNVPSALTTQPSLCLPVNTRNSSSSMQLRTKQKDQKDEIQYCKDRFSYPVTNGNGQRFLEKCGDKMQLKDKRINKSNSQQCLPLSTLMSNSAHHLTKGSSELYRQKICNSLSDTLNPLMGKPSADMCEKVKTEMERSKVSITPCSPAQSPRYSLLMGETSSENSSCGNTPHCDIDLLELHSAETETAELTAGGSIPLSNRQLFHKSPLFEANMTSKENQITSHFPECLIMDKRDIKALKMGLSLDLYSACPKMMNDHVDAGATFTNKQQLISPNSNFTDNTSQSVTPSEFGYQYLQRPSSMHSLLETEENSLTYEDIDHGRCDTTSPTENTTQKITTPIKSTISITYNLKDNGTEDNIKSQAKTIPVEEKPLLETSFDEHTVYEQVKFFRNSVTEVNQLLDNDRRSLQFVKSPKKSNHKSADASQKRGIVLPSSVHSDNKDDRRLDLAKEKILKSTEETKPLYENVELRRPESVYENILGQDMRSYSKRHQSAKNFSKDIQDLDSLETVSVDSVPMKNAIPTGLLEPEGQENCQSSNPTSNFSVKELANKFESSPVGHPPAYEFNARNSTKKKSTQMAVLERKSSPASGLGGANKMSASSAGSKDKLTSSQKITRSLDENAFVREFDSKPLRDACKSSQQLPELIEFNKRCKSVDFMRPKTLNPPKRLPGMPITEETYTKSDLKSSSTRKTHKEPNAKSYFNQPVLSEALSSSHDHGCEPSELKTMPGRMEGFGAQINPNSKAPWTDASNQNTGIAGNNNLKVLLDVKLNRERIDKIKEERRQQLTQKYRGESFKSKSRTELNSSKDDDKTTIESTVFKSKSRGDLAAFKDVDRTSDCGQLVDMGTYLSTDYVASDDKNQNYDFHNETCKVPDTNALMKSIEKIQRSNDWEKQMNFTSASINVPNGPDITREQWHGNLNEATSAEIASSALNSRNSFKARHEKISPQFSIRDVTAMFESRSLNPE